MTESRWAGVAGIVFAVLLVVGIIVMTADMPVDDDPDEEFTQFYDDSGNRTQVVAGAYMLVVSALAFLAFTGLGLYGPARASGNDAARTLAGLGMAAALMAAAGVCVGAIALASTAAAVEFGDAPLDVGVARFLPSVGYGSLLVWGGLSFSAAIAGLSLAGQKAGTLRTWQVWLGYIAAIVALFSLFFLPMIAVPLWALILSVVALTERAGSRTVAPAMG